VSSYDKSEDTNRDPSVNPTKVTENWLSCIGRDNLTNDSECWYDKNINFRVTEEPEKVLVKNWVSTCCWVIEACIEVTVSKKPSDCSGKNW